MLGPITYLDAALIAVVLHLRAGGHVPRPHARDAVDPVLGRRRRRRRSTSSSITSRSPRRWRSRWARPGRRRARSPSAASSFWSCSSSCTSSPPRISDAILDSRIGMIDRILGFIFGVVRGFVLIVIPYMFYESFFPDPKHALPVGARGEVAALHQGRPAIRSALCWNRYMPSSLTAPARRAAARRGIRVSVQQGALRSLARLAHEARRISYILSLATARSPC